MKNFKKGDFVAVTYKDGNKEFGYVTSYVTPDPTAFEGATIAREGTVYVRRADGSIFSISPAAVTPA